MGKTQRVRSDTPRGAQKGKMDVPSLVQLGSLNSGSLHRGSAWKAADEDVHVYIQQYCHDGSVYKGSFQHLPGVPLLAANLRCGARPSPIFKFQQALERFAELLKKEHPENDQPVTFEELQRDFCMAFQFNSNQNRDPDNVGFQVVFWGPNV